uniref:Uncharacterized protein n=2 Tax=Arion vulgaris TaxID=1028688 RepID=A0A0B6ZU90_9EUPU
MQVRSQLEKSMNQKAAVVLKPVTKVAVQVKRMPRSDIDVMKTMSNHIIVHIMHHQVIPKGHDCIAWPELMFVKGL